MSQTSELKASGWLIQYNFLKERQISNGHLADLSSFHGILLLSVWNSLLNTLCFYCKAHFPLSALHCPLSLSAKPQTYLHSLNTRNHDPNCRKARVSSVAVGWQEGHSVISRLNSIWGIGDWLVGLSGGQPCDQDGGRDTPAGWATMPCWLTDQGSAGSAQSWPRS